MKSLIREGKAILKYRKDLFESRNKEIMSYFFNLIKPIPSDQIRVVIFGHGRTGSSLLEDLICSTGYFRKNGELLHNQLYGEVRYPIQYIRGVSKRVSNENFIFHVKPRQLTGEDRKNPIDPSVFLNSLVYDGWKVIYLRRRNTVNHVLSCLVAVHRKAWHKFSDDKEHPRISINCENFIKTMNIRFHRNDVESRALANIRYHEVVYEDDLLHSYNHQKTIDSILEYLSMDRRLANSKYRKINTQSPKDLIQNYDEFVDCLIKHGWQRFLEK